MGGGLKLRRSKLVIPAKARIQYGFTLIELMITVAILSLLVLMSYPSYQDYILKGRRIEAKVALLTLAATLTQDPMKPFIDKSSGGFYHLQKTIESPTEYTLIATPIGPQAVDHCGRFMLTNTHLKSAQQADCW